MVKLVAITQGAGELTTRSAQDVISYITRVSAPLNQNNFNTASKLLKYCLQHGHFSPFEHAYITLEIETSRAIATQVLRHRSFTFQEFSQRYSKSSDFIEYEARQQDLKNRQNSTDTLSDETKAFFKMAQEHIWREAKSLYDKALELNVAKECARFLLPLNTKTKLYMTGSVRSWIHYIELRSANGTQKEHMDIALECRTIIGEQFPDIKEALEWSCG